MAINKIIYGGNTLLDLTSDTADESTVINGATFHKSDGTKSTGTCTYDSDTSDATVQVAEMLINKTAYARGSKMTGTMPNNGAITGEISNLNEYTIPQGYHDGSGTVGISSTEKSKIVAGNIKSGITITGAKGTYTGASINAQSKTVTPSTSSQTIQPDNGYDYLSSITLNPIPYSESANSAGGTTVTIG